MTSQFSELILVLILKFYQMKFENLIRNRQITVFIVQRN